MSSATYAVRSGSVVLARSSVRSCSLSPFLFRLQHLKLWLVTYTTGAGSTMSIAVVAVPITLPLSCAVTVATQPTAGVALTTGHELVVSDALQILIR
jgi:hypothetical protein